MELRDLEAFDRLSQALHFGRTARLLGMSPSALTRRIQALEDELGVALLSRDQRAVELTRAGEVFRDFAREELGRFNELRTALRQDEASPAGELKIACTVTACHSVLPRLLADCRVRFPQIRVSLVTQDAARSLEELERGEVDLAVVPTEPNEKTPLARRRLDHTDLVFVAPTHLADVGLAERDLLAPCFPELLVQVPFVFPQAGLERRRLEAFFREHGASPKVVAEVRGNEGVLAMVSLGSGVSLVPRLVLEQSPLLPRVQKLDAWPAPAGYDVSLCAQPRVLRRPWVRAFWDLGLEAP